MVRNGARKEERVKSEERGLIDFRDLSLGCVLEGVFLEPVFLKCQFHVRKKKKRTKEEVKVQGQGLVSHSHQWSRISRGIDEARKHHGVEARRLKLLKFWHLTRLDVAK